MNILWPIVVGFAFCAGAAHGELYQWTDKNGHRVYSDLPPSDGIPYTKRAPSSLPHVLTTQSEKPPPRSNKSSGNARVISDSRSKSGTGKDRGRCKYYLDKIEYYERLLRKPHSGNRGEYLRREKREYSEAYYKECR